MKKGSILVIDDKKNVLTALRILLNNYFEKVRLLSSPNQIHAALCEESFDVVLLDMNFSAGINNENEGLFWLSEIKNMMRIFLLFCLPLMQILTWLLRL